MALPDSWLKSPPRPSVQHTALAAERQQVLTKPPGSLGQLEKLAINLAGLNGSDKPSVDPVRMVVFAGDHGVCAEGVSAFPQAVTAQMIANFASGGAAISVMAEELGASLEVVNLGTVGEVPALPGVIHQIIAPSTANMAKSPAMSSRQVESALYSGDDALMPYFAQAGAKGLVSVAANAWPLQTHEFVKRSLSGQHPNLFAQWTRAINSLFAVANPIPVKVLMHQQGRLNSPLLRPPLTHLELTQTDCITTANDTILSWH